MQKFEKGFFVGAATAAHQVEGNNIHSDYWAQEQLPVSYTHLDVYKRQGKHRQPQPLGREAGEHSVKGERLDQEAGNHQDAQLAELGVDAVIDKGKQGIGDAVQNTGCLLYTSRCV